MDQQSLRSSILARRRGLDSETRRRASGSILDRLREAWEREALHPGMNIGIYRSMPEEIDLEPVVQWLEEAGNRMYFPRIADASQGRLDWACVKTADGHLWRANQFGILEPCEDVETSTASLLDMIFVPGVAFGLEGQRIGMGKGFYDRVLASHAGALRISVAYDFQILPEVPQNPWDKRVHWIFSERREIQACRLRDRIGQLSR